MHLCTWSVGAGSLLTSMISCWPACCTALIALLRLGGIEVMKFKLSLTIPPSKVSFQRNQQIASFLELAADLIRDNPDNVAPILDSAGNRMLTFDVEGE